MPNFLHHLGLIKISQAVYFEQLNDFLDQLVAAILRQKNLDDDSYSESACEIKIFFWVFSTPIFSKTLPDKLFDDTMKFFRDEVIFRTIDKSEYSEDDLQNLLQSRLEFHVHGIQGMGDSNVADDYLKRLKFLWFEEPFSNRSQEDNIFDLGIENMFIGLNEIKQMYIEYTPWFDKSLRKLIKMTKK